MFKKIILIIIFILPLVSCEKNDNSIQTKSESTETKVDKNSAIIGDIGNDICSEFSEDFIYSVIHKPIVKVEPSKLSGVFSCNYFTDYKEDFYKDEKYNYVGAGGPSITIVLDNLNVEKQKTGRTFLGLTLGSSSKIGMENIISYRKNKSIWSVDLIINPNRFVWANYSHKAITDDELLILAEAMAEKIQGKLTIKIEKNPVNLIKEKEKPIGVSQIQIVNKFFENIGLKDFDNAIALMDANDDTKKSWKSNFENITNLKVESCVEHFKEEWTPTLQRFKCNLDIIIKPQGEQMGWNKGKNIRYIMVTKTGDKWFIHELANNP